MRLLLSPRGFGKTTEAVKEAVLNDAVLVVINSQEVDRIWHYFKPMFPNLKRPITFEEFLSFAGKRLESEMRRNFDERYVLDEAGSFLRRQFGDRLIFSTWTQDWPRVPLGEIDRDMYRRYVLGDFPPAAKPIEVAPSEKPRPKKPIRKQRKSDW